jgi:hypothetical protein
MRGSNRYFFARQEALQFSMAAACMPKTIALSMKRTQTTGDTLVYQSKSISTPFAGSMMLAPTTNRR